MNSLQATIESVFRNESGRIIAGLIRVSRSYEALTKMIQGYKDLDTRTAREVGGGSH